MAYFEIPTRNDVSSYDFSIDLDGQTYGFEIHWNERAQRYVFSIFDVAGNPLLTGVPLVVNWEFLARFSDPSLPPGQLMLVDTSGTGSECGQADLGDRCRLYYAEALST